MMLSGIGEWLDRGPFTTRDVALYRILYAVVGLLALPQYSWLTHIPESFFNPPPGVFRLASGFPAPSLLIAMDIGLAVALTALLIGLATPAMSLVVFILVIVGEGFSYSTGKIDHTILLAIVPLAMAFSGWGRALSVDSVLRHRLHDRPISQRPLRVLALCVGAAMMTAGLPKLFNGWLDPRSQASYGYQWLEFASNDRQAGLARILIKFPEPFFWEALDWLTVFLECGLLFTVLSWRAFRVGLALFTLFHLGVLLSLNIAFWPNLVAYAAFVSWSQIVPHGRINLLRRLNRTRSSRTVLLIYAIVVTIVIGIVSWWLSGIIGQSRLNWMGPTIVVLGAVAGIIYLAYLSWRVVWRRMVRS